MAYQDLRAYLDELKKRALLRVIDEKFCKDTELVPLVRLQFRGLAEEERKIRQNPAARVTDLLKEVFGKKR